VTTKGRRLFTSAQRVSRKAIICLFTVLLLTSGILIALNLRAHAGEVPDEGSGKKKIPPYALIFGTIWDAQDRPAYGVPIKIRRADEKKAKWELRSDRRGEFAQRVPAGAAEYVVWADLKPPKGKADWKATETKVVIQNDERIDITLHLTE
jgi:hypothetical protein